MQAAQKTDRPAIAGRHIVELDGVRALAIWLVLANHLLDATSRGLGPAAFGKLPGLVRTIIHHGYLGVDLFFVLSGFLITGILLRTKDLGVGKYFRHFYTRRALRILPLYLLLIVLIAIFVGKTALPWLVLAGLMSANLSGLLGVDVPAPSGPFWSLAVEEQFYLVWPWLVFWLRPRGLVAVAVAIFAIEPILRLVVPGDLILPWYHSDGLAMGALLAVWFSRWNGEVRALQLLIAGLLAAFVAVTLAVIPFGGLAEGPIAVGVRLTQADLCFGALVAAAVGFSGARALGVLRWRAATYTALLSYCIYLVHRPLVTIYDFWSPRLIPAAAHFSEAQNGIARALFVVVSAYVVASVSWKFYESPFLRRGRELTPVGFAQRASTTSTP